MIASGAQEPNSLLIVGPATILGAIAYRSAKKRFLRDVGDTQVRKIWEVILIFTALAIVFLQKDIRFLIAHDPVPNLIIPIWILAAYLFARFRKTRN